MSVTSKSPKAVLVSALKVAEASLPAYCHKNSPKKFTQHQLFACLVLKNFLKTDYRGVVRHLKDCPSLAKAVDLDVVPHYTTLQKAARRLLVSTAAQRLLDETVDRYIGRRCVVANAAIDSTGLGATCASSYFVKRRATKESAWKSVAYHRYPKLGLVSDVASHVILAFQASSGPRPDVNEFEGLIQQAARRVRMTCIIADAGYDSESNHAFARQSLLARTIIPPLHGRPSTKPAKGYRISPV